MRLQTPLPVVALTLGDAAGIGPELIAKLLSQPDITRGVNVVLVGDCWLWEAGQATAGVQVPTQIVASLAEVRQRADTQLPAFLPLNTIAADQVQRIFKRTGNEQNDRHLRHFGHKGNGTGGKRAKDFIRAAAFDHVAVHQAAEQPFHDG